MWRNWNPFGEMDALRREIDRVFEGYAPKWTGWRSVFLPGVSARNYPLLNVAEDAESIVVEALAPGLETETLHVSVKGDTLTVEGEKKPLSGVKPEAFHRSERAAGKFVRTLELPSEIEEAKVKAEYANGLLTITLPKAERAKPKQITVKVK